MLVTLWGQRVKACDFVKHPIISIYWTIKHTAPTEGLGLVGMGRLKIAKICEQRHCDWILNHPSFA